MRRLLLLIAAALVFSGVAAADTPVFTASGPMSFGKPLTATFSTTAYQDMTITLTVTDPKVGAQYLVALEHFYNSQYTDESCINDVIGPGATASCTVANAEPGTWTVYAHPVSGKSGTAQGSVVVTAP